jgi:hypothetical protein
MMMMRDFGSSIIALSQFLLSINFIRKEKSRWWVMNRKEKRPFEMKVKPAK